MNPKEQPRSAEDINAKIGQILADYGTEKIMIGTAVREIRRLFPSVQPQPEPVEAFKVFRFPHEENKSPASANEEQNPMEATIHLSGDYGNTVSEAAQIIFFKYKDGKLGVEVYPTEEISIVFKMAGPISFNLSPVARKMLMRFLNNNQNEY